jgi:hypothetical protein
MNFINKINSSQWAFYVILILFLQLPSFRIIYKVSPNHYQVIIPLFLSMVVVYYFILFGYKSQFFEKLSQSVTLTLFILIALLTINYFAYPILDARKVLKLGSDQDDAMIAVAKALFSGHSPYHIKTYLCPGASTGPGLVILLSPFVLTNTYFSVTPILVAILSYLIYRRTKKFKTVNIFLLLLISSPLFWEMMTNGSDLPAFGIFCVIPLLIWKDTMPVYLKMVVFLFISMTLTSRIIFIYLAPLYGLFLCDRSWLKWIKYTSIVVLITVLFHLIFYLIDPTHYSPLLLVNYGLIFLSLRMGIVGSVLFLSIFLKTVQWSLDRNSHFTLLWLWVALPLLFISFISFNFHLFVLDQYPFTFFTPQIPILLTCFALNNQASFKNENADN